MGFLSNASQAIGGSASGSKEAEKQVKKSAQAQNAAINEAVNQLNLDWQPIYDEVNSGYNTALGDLGSAYTNTSGLWGNDISLGNDAVTRLGQLTDPNETYYAEDPGYQWRLQQGLEAAQNSAVARRMGMSGNTLTALNDYAQGAASQEYGNTFNRYLQLAQYGQRADAQQMANEQWYYGNKGNLEVNKSGSLASLMQNKSDAMQNYQLARGGVNSNLYNQKANLALANAPIALASTALAAYMGGGYSGPQQVQGTSTTQQQPQQGYSGTLSNGYNYNSNQMNGQGTSMSSLYGW